MFLGEGWDGVISCFLWKLHSLIALVNEDNKCNGLNENQCVIKQVFISNHFTTPFILNRWGSVRGEASVRRKWCPFRVSDHR